MHRQRDTTPAPLTVTLDNGHHLVFVSDVDFCNAVDRNATRNDTTKKHGLILFDETLRSLCKGYTLYTPFHDMCVVRLADPLPGTTQSGDMDGMDVVCFRLYAAPPSTENALLSH